MKENYDDSLFLQNGKIIGYVIDSELIKLMKATKSFSYKAFNFLVNLKYKGSIQSTDLIVIQFACLPVTHLFAVLAISFWKHFNYSHNNA